MDVSIIVVNYNTFELTTACIRSIYEKTKGLDYEVVLVDNASSEHPADGFKEIFPKIHLLKSPANAGFAGGNNLGIAQSTGRHILLLNSDTELENNAVALAHDKLQKDPRIGALSAKLSYPDGRVQFACNRFPELKYELLQFLRLHKLLDRKTRGELLLGSYFAHDYEIEADWVWGTFFMFPREVLTVFEGERLSEPSFMYGEDREWCFLIKKAGYKILYYPAAQVIHKLGGAGYFDDQRERSDHLGKLESRFVRQHYGRFRAAAFQAVRAVSRKCDSWSQ